MSRLTSGLPTRWSPWRTTLWPGGDVFAVILFIALAPAAHSVTAIAQLRLAIAGSLLFFVPGYLLMTALTPAAGIVQPATRSDDYQFDSILQGPVVYLGLAVAVSIALLPLYGLALWIAGIGIAGYELMPISGALLALGAIAWYRRVGIVADEAPTSTTGAAVGAALSRVRDQPRGEQLVIGLLAMAIVLSLGVLTLGLAAPPDGEQYSQLSIGSIQADGDFSLGGAPDELAVNESAEYAVLVANHEGESVTYSVTAELQHVEDGEVNRSDAVAQTTIEVADGESSVVELDVRPTTPGEGQRLVVSLTDTGDGPPSVDKEVSIWVDVLAP